MSKEEYDARSILNSINITKENYGITQSRFNEKFEKLFGTKFYMFDSSVRKNMYKILKNVAKFKSESCPYLANNTCSKGANCSFAHEDENIRPADQQMIDNICIL